MRRDEVRGEGVLMLPFNCCGTVHTHTLDGEHKTQEIACVLLQTRTCAAVVAALLSEP